MRIVVLSQWYPPERVNVPADVAKVLTINGHDVMVVTGFPNYPDGDLFDGWRMQLRRDAIEDGCRVRRVALYPSHDRSAVRRAFNYLSFAGSSTAFGWQALRGADVVYVYHSPLTAATGPWLSQFLRGARYVLHVQDVWPDPVTHTGLLSDRTARVVSTALTPMCRTVYRRASRVVCIAPTMASRLVDRGVAPGRVEVVYNWADEEQFRPTERDDATAGALGLRDTFSVMFAGNVGHGQDLDTAIRAAHEVRDLVGFRLAIVGGGVALDALRRLVAELGVRNVVFVPDQPVTSMGAVTAVADVQLVSSRDLAPLRATVPSKLGAVLASGLPVICAVGDDAARLVDEAGAGWTCAPGDVRALAEAFRTVHRTSQDELRRRGCAGRRFYEQRLARSIGVARIEGVLADAVSDRRP